MLTQHIILALLWIFFCALHSAFASLWWKGKMKKVLGSSFRFYRLWYTLFAFATLGAVLVFQISIPSPHLFATNTFSTGAGILLSGTGVVIMVICIRKYFMNLSGLKSLYLNDEQAANELQVSGIHRYVRHPLYSGTFMAIWGLWLLIPLGSLSIANSIITLYTVWAISWEEQKLVQEFGEAYKRYQQQVPRLVPTPWKWHRVRF